jgi:hypothetical protein
MLLQRWQQRSKARVYVWQQQQLLDLMQAPAPRLHQQLSHVERCCQVGEAVQQVGAPQAQLGQQPVKAQRDNQVACSSYINSGMSEWQQQPIAA